MADKPKPLTIRGRLSFPMFTYQEALAFNKKSDYPKDDNKVKPHFYLLLTEAAAEKLIAYIRDEFVPWALQQEKEKPGNKSGGFTAAQAKKILRALEEKPWEDDPKDGVSGLIYGVKPATAELAPEAVISLKVNGFPRQDVPLKAIVRSEESLRNPMDDVVIPPRGAVMDLTDTTLDMYPGAVVAAQIDMFGFVSNNVPGITSGTPAAVLVADAPSFRGGGALDEDDIFMNDDE